MASLLSIRAIPSVVLLLAALADPGRLLKMPVPGLHPRLTELESPEGGTQVPGISSALQV